MGRKGALCSLTALPPPILSHVRVHLPLQPLGAAFGLTPLPREAKTHSPPGAEVVWLRKPTSSRVCPEIWFQDSIQSVWAITTLTLSVWGRRGTGNEMQEKERVPSDE